MIGKIQITSSEYDPDGPRVNDPTLGDPNTHAKEVGLSPVGRRLMLVPCDPLPIGNSGLTVETGALPKELRLCLVLAVGPKVKDWNPNVVPGVAVWLKPFAGTEVIVNGQTVIFITPDQITGRVNSSR